MLIIGHRGAKGLAPENTKASFLAALDSGVDGIEFDIRTSLDGQIILNHDPEINGLEIAKTSFAELKIAKPDLLLLQEAFDITGGKCAVIVEIKKGADMKVIVKAFTEMKLPEEMLVASFSYPILASVKFQFPDIPLIVNEKWSGVRGTRRCALLKTKSISMNQKWLWWGFIKSMSRSGYELFAYPLNDPKKVKKWAKAGLHGAITDFPDRIV